MRRAGQVATRGGLLDVAVRRLGDDEAGLRSRMEMLCGASKSHAMYIWHACIGVCAFG